MHVTCMLVCGEENSEIYVKNVNTPRPSGPASNKGERRTHYANRLWFPGHLFGLLLRLTDAEWRAGPHPRHHSESQAEKTKAAALAVHMVVAGFLVMDSRAGSLIYSQRFSPAYGLASCDQGALTHCSYRPSYSRSLTSAACPCLPQLGTRCA